jgi:hypothetical protein
MALTLAVHGRAPLFMGSGFPEELTLRPPDPAKTWKKVSKNLI